MLLVRAARRAAWARAAVGLPRLGLSADAVPLTAIAVLGVLIGLAGAQPSLRSRELARVRADAAAYVVVDTSRSMLAAATATSPTRLERAKRAALRLRAALGDVPAGVASLSDRVLPHLFPSPDPAAFAAVVGAARAGHPAPTHGGRQATDLGSLAALPTSNYFAPEIRRRALVVLTDAETVPVDGGQLAAAFRTEPRAALVIVRFGRPGELVHGADGRPEAAYAPDPGAPAAARRLAAVAGGLAFSEERLGRALEAVRRGLRGGARTQVERRERRLELAPYLLAAASAPLAVLLWRLNLAGGGLRVLATLQAARRRSSVG